MSSSAKDFELAQEVVDRIVGHVEELVALGKTYDEAIDHAFHRFSIKANGGVMREDIAKIVADHKLGNTGNSGETVVGVTDYRKESST